MSNKIQAALDARKSRKKTEEESFKEKAKKSQEKIDSALQARESRIKNNLQSTFSDLESSINAEIEAFKKLSNPSWGGGNEALKTSLESTRQNRINVDNLIRKVEAHRKYLGDEKADTILSSLNDMKSGYSTHVNVAEVRSQYKSEEEYEKKYEELVKAQENYEAMKTLNLETAKKEISDLETKKKERDNIKSKRDTLYNQIYTGYLRGGYSKEKAESTALKDARIVSYDKQLSAYGDIDSSLSGKKTTYNQAKHIQDGIKLHNDAINAEDFEEYVQKGKGLDDGRVLLYIANHNVNGNEVEAVRRYFADGEISLGRGDRTNMILSMTDEEASIYNYYLGKNGKDKAEEYLKTIEESLNSRTATEFYSELEGKTATELYFGVVSGLDQFASGMENLFNTKDDYIPQSVSQMTSGMVREDLGDSDFKILGSSVGQIGYDLINTTSNMLPSILTSTVVGWINPALGAAVGAGLMGASASGNAYAEMLNLGYDKGQARLYSGLVGVSEAALQYLLGGIGKLGGKLSSKVAVGIVNNLDNAFARVAIKLGGNALGEFSEEYLQEVLNPIFKNLALGTNEDVKLFSTEALYSGILGALSAGILETGSTISADRQTTKLGKSVQNIDGGVARLKKLGTTFSADSVANQIADKVTDETGAYKIGLLLQEVGATLSEQNVSDITIELTKKGMDETTAKRLAKTYQAFLNNEMSLTDEQVEVLEGLDPLKDVLRKSIIGRNTSIYQKTREYSDLVKLATEVAPTPNTDTEASAQPTALYSKEYIDAVAKEFEANGFPAEQARILAEMKLSTPTETNSSPTEENAIESEFEVSADGKTINKNTDKIVNVKNIESISESGEANLTLDDGIVVKASDLAYGNDAEAIFIENIGKIKLGKKNISTNSANLIYMKAMKALENNPKMTADEAMSLIKGLEESYVYGAYNFSRSELSAQNEDGTAKRYAGELSQEQRAFAYELGTQDRVSEVEKDQKVIDELKAKAKANNDTSAKTTTKKGSVRFENGVVAKGKNQKRAVSLAKHLARAIGIDIVFYDAKTTTNKDGKGANGYFDPKTDTIYLDLQNSWSDAKTIAYTMSHELVHFIKKWSPEKFNTFAKFLMEQYGKHGVDASKLLSNKMTDLKTTDADLAYEEMVCDACETMLLDSNAIYKLMELRKTDLELFDKIKLHIHELLNKIRNMYKKLGLNPTSNEAKALLEMKDVLGQIYSMFEEAAVDAAQSYQAVSTLETESVSVSEDGTVMMQMKQYQQTGRATLLKYLKEQYGDADANNLIATIDNIYNTMKDIKKDETLTVFSNWQDSEVELDENGHPIFTTSINNGDYELNQDFSRVCKKRRQLDFVLNMLAEDPAFEASNLTKQDFVKINKAIKEHGFEIACALCFVDSKRFRQAEWADSFANTWNDILYSVVDDKSKLTPFNFATKNPNLADDGIDIDTSKPVMYRKWSEGKEDVKNRKNYDSFENMLSKDGKKWIEGNTNVRTIATLIRDNPNLRHTFRGADIIASQGFDTIQRLAPGIRGILDGWGGSSVPKPSSNDASYDSSIINMSCYNKETAYAMGGARMNSFSDFMAHMFFDYCQAFADLAAKELPSQAYTKELIYVRLFGRSGQKINMSGIAAIRDDALPTTAQKGVSKAEAEANEKIEKMVAGLDVSRLLEHLNKDIHQLTEADVEQFLDMCDYVWADESINMKHATLLQTGILYDKLSESKIEECYELLKAGEVEKALKVAGKANVDTEYAKHCGTIVVGVSDAHIRKLLRDPTVRMVIPYHKSGLNPIIARELRISAYNDYTLTQTTGVKRRGAKATAKIGSDEIKKAYGLKDFSFYDWFGKTIDGKVYDGKATADKYLEWCEKGYYDEKVGDYVYYTNKGDGYILAKDFHKKATIVPKFEAFMGEENYYKVLEDFDCYNTISGEHSEQGAVDFLRNGLPSDYKSVLMDALKAEQKVSDDFRDHLDNKGLKDEIMDIVKANGYEPSVKKQAKSNSRITSEMSDTERSEILRAKQIVATLYQGQADALIAKNKESLESQQLRLVKAAIATIGKEFGIIGEKINITDVDVVITLSKSNLKESVSKDVTPIQLAKLLPILKVAVENAVGIESHNNRYYFDTDTVYFENLLGGYIDGEDFVPVRFGLKHSVSGNTTLYVVVDQNKIKANLLKEKTKTEVLKATDPHEVDSSASRSVTYDIPQILKFVNSKDLLRYVPDDMLSVEQRESKWEAIAETIKKTDSKNDKKYAEYISKGNLYAAQQMVVAAAKTAGYTRKLYHGTPSKFNVFGFGRTGIFTTDNYDMAKTYGENVISLYGKEGANVLTIDAQESPHYAIRVSKDVLDFSEYPLMRGKELHSTNDISIIAFREGYDVVVIKNVYDNYSFASENAENGLGTDVVYKDPSQVKSSEVITYDDNGNIIPISQRFDSKKEDIRYQKKTASNRSILANALEGVAENDIEKNKLKEYKEKISLIESEEQRLSEIHQQLFTKGGVEPSQRKELQFEAKQIANRINTYDRQLLRLEATKPLQNVLNREKELARKRQKQKDAEALREYKEKVAKTTRELLDRNRESRKKAIESREKTAMRHKIQKVVGDLNNLLLKPTKERHVPEEMRIAVAEALSIVNMDTVDADTRVAHYNDLIAKAKDPDVIASLTETRDRIQAQGSKLSEKLSKLKEAYGLARDSADDSLRSMYDDVIYNKIESVQKKVGKTPIRNMTLEQLESVYELYKMVLTTVRDSNKAFAEDLKMTRQALGSNTFAEIKENNKTRDRIRYEFIEKFGWQNLKPMQAMKTIGSGTLQKLWNNILYGQEVFAQDYDEAVKFAKEMKDKYGYKKWNLKKLYSFESKSGKTMKISLEQMMSIYAYSKRQQADEHIEYGGIVLNEGIIEEKNKLGKTVKVKVNDSTAYRLDRMQVGQIIETLEKEAPGAKTFVDEMQKYLSETMGEKGNEVSMKMYGIRLFKEEHYFPLKSSKDFMEAANAKLKGDVKIKNKGMTKSTVEHARNPIVLENFLDVWGNHINEMAMYHGLVLPLEDFSRTLNYGFKADESLNTDAESVRTALHDAFGENADNYLNELLKAINGGVLHDSSAAFADKMISKFKKAKVMASLSVVVQQPTAIIRAMGIIEPKYFVAQNLHHKSTWEELKKYCPTAIIKETGSFDTNMGRTIVDMIKEEQGFTDKVGDFLGKAPAFMDEVGWNMIWRALKNKVATEQKLSGEALLQECGKQMTLILNETQVYDSVMSRNELMRSKNALTKMATAFMAEPSTVANMIYGAALDFKRGKKGVAGKTVAAVISSVVVNGLVSAMVYALRDDDEDETLLEKYLSSATAEVLDGLNPLTYIPFIKDAWSLFQGYDVERTDMALIGDVVDAVNNFYNVLDPEAYEDMSKGEIAKHIYENSVPMLTSICDMFGLPVGNILRDAKSIIINDNVPMSQTSSKGIGYAFKDGVLGTLPEIVGKFVGTDSKQDKLYDAIVSGDSTYLKRLKSGYKDDKAYETAVRKALRENDSRIKEAAEARIDGNIAEYARIVKAIKAEGFFSQDTIVASVNAEINAINKGESSSSNSSTEDKASSIYKIDDYYASIMGGDQASAYVVKEDIINIDVANGKDRDEAESNFNSKFASYLREEYEKGNLSEQEAERMLVNYGDKSEEEAASKVQYWEFKQKYPDYDDLSEEAVTKYYDKVEPYGINIGVYYDYSKQRSKCKGTDANGDGKTDSGSVKTEVLRVINSLPISSSQKDALYYLNGWSAKTIYEAPWH